jgi:guanylate kinase
MLRHSSFGLVSEFGFRNSDFDDGVDTTMASESGERLGLGRNLIIISGPSGAGKTTVCRAVAPRLGLKVSTSATTRKQRKGETDGVDYHFLTRAEFERRVAAGRFVEWAEVFGNLYGTPVDELEQARADGRTLLLEIDVQGGCQIKQKYPEALAILLLPPDPQALRSRLTGRGTEAPEEAQARFAAAQQEIEMARRSRCYDAEVVNDDLAAAIENVVRRIETRRRDS